jgi:thiol-disulfide isomerase/thioredoxin
MFRRLSAIALFALLSGAASLHFVRAQETASHFNDLSSPESPPDLMINDDKGQDVSLKSFSGHYVLLHLWATWCAPCVAELPALDALTAKLDPAKFAVLALDEDRDDVALVHSFYKRHEIDHLAAYIDSDGRDPSRLHTYGLPTTFLIGPDGRIRARLDGEADWANPDMLRYLSTLTR